MELLLKYVIKFLIVACAVDIAIFKPIPGSQKMKTQTNAVVDEGIVQNNLLPRAQRQVVQPKWLQGKTVNPNPPAAKEVRITEQNLKEAAEIRAIIQDAVDNDKFAVKPDPDQPTNPIENSDNNEKSPFPTFRLPAEWNSFPVFLTPEQQQAEFANFWEEVQKMWSDITENYIEYLFKEFTWFQT